MKKRIIVFLLLLLLLILSPRVYWSLKEPISLEIAVIDYTVPTKDYREHNGLFQVLTSKKIVREDGELYDVGKDYYGFDPYDKVQTEPFENHQVDMIYITDTYGVYSDDLEEKPDGERSELLFGGMDLLDWNGLMQSKDDQTTLIAEFNSFASPTSEEVSKIMQQTLGLTWSGWIGRYFPDLANDEIPQWLIDNYEQQAQQEWSFEGPGMAYVHTTDQVIILNEDEIKGSVNFTLTEQGKHKFSSVHSSEYMYWFDIVEPLGGTEVLASYKVELEDIGADKLRAAGIPTQFPAVLFRENDLTYYFAGDYADFDKQPIVTWESIHHVYKFFAKDVSSFYWLSYFPMMEDILNEAINRKRGVLHAE